MRHPSHHSPVPGIRPARDTNHASNVEEQVQVLAGLDLAALRDRWRQTFGRSARSGLGRDFLARALAYHIQTDAMGDIDRKTSRTLDQLAVGNTAAVTRDQAPGRNLHPGTELVREYQGHHHRITVLREGFEWNGATYSSLSGVARAITGSNWNGYAFFGLAERRHG